MRSSVIAGNLISDSTIDVENYLEGSGVDGTSRFVKSSHGLAREVLVAEWGNNTPGLNGCLCFNCVEDRTTTSCEVLRACLKSSQVRLKSSQVQGLRLPVGSLSYDD